MDTRRFYLAWFAATLAYGVGDLVTTLAVFDHPGLLEANGLVVWLFHHLGAPGIAGLKIVTILFCVWMSWDAFRSGDRLAYYFFPVATLLIGVFLTTFNWTLLSG